MLDENSKILGIDFSLNATCLCLLDLESKRIHYFSFLRKNRLTRHQIKLVEMLEKSTSSYKNIYLPPLISVSDFSGNEIQKISDADNLVNLILNIIKDYNVSIVFLEAPANNSISSRRIELIGYQYILRHSIYTKFPHISFNIFSIKQIKSFAGSGNYDKLDMLSAYLKSQIRYSFQDDLKNFILNHQDLIVKRNIILEPFCGLIDAYWIANMFFKILN